MAIVIPSVGLLWSLSLITPPTPTHTHSNTPLTTKYLLLIALFSYTHILDSYDSQGGREEVKEGGGYREARECRDE